MKLFDTIIIGGGQSGLSVAYFLKRYSINYVILDDHETSGGAWLETWDSLKLFSPKEYSSLSGWQIPLTEGEYPTKQELIEYLNQYEKRYNFPINRNVKVSNVYKKENFYIIETNKGTYHCKTIVSATGTAKEPFIPYYKGQKLFEGEQLHSVAYKNPDKYKDKKVLVVGGGNSGAQILSEVSLVTSTVWSTKTPPIFLPENIDGRYLFQEANKLFTSNKKEKKLHSLTDIVMIKSVREAKSRGVLVSKGEFTSLTKNGVIWSNNEEEKIDVIIWCTGFKPNLKHFTSLNIIENNKVKTTETQSVKYPNIWLVGYGNWTGFASATIYGVGKTAKVTAQEINNYLTEN